MSTIAVPPAIVLEASPDEVVEATFANASTGIAVEASVRESLTSQSGVAGTLLRLSGRRPGPADLFFRDIAVFVAGDRVYRMRLDTTNASQLLELRELLGAVARSFQPLDFLQERAS